MRWSVALLTILACSEPLDPAAEQTGELTAAAKEASRVPSPPAGEITFGRELKERLLEVPIDTKAFGKPKVLYSIALEDLTTTEELFLRGELTLSTCGGKDTSGDASDGEKNPCSIPQLKASPYDYAPHFGAYLAFGDSPSDTKGDKLTPVVQTTCTGREHHCTLAIPETRGASKSAAPRRYVNMIVAADDPKARGFDLMIVEQGHGILTVTRAAPGSTPAKLASSDAPLPKGPIDIDREEGDSGPLGVDPKVAHEIYQVKLEGLRPGDVIDADAKLIAKVKNGPSECDALISSEILVSSDAKPAARTKKGDGDEHATQKNGINCVDHGGECVYEKSGAVQLGNKASETMFVTLVTTAGRTCVPPGYIWEVQKGGRLQVKVRSANVK